MSDNEETPENRLRKELPEEVPATEPDVPAAPEEKLPSLTGRQRLVKGLWPPRVTRAQLIVAVLLFGLGFGLAVQVASNSNSDSALRGARQEDLVRILDELDDRRNLRPDQQAGHDSHYEAQYGDHGAPFSVFSVFGCAVRTITLGAAGSRRSPSTEMLVRMP